MGISDDLPRLYGDDHRYSTCVRYPQRKRKLPEIFKGMVRRGIEYPNGVLQSKGGKLLPLSRFTNLIPDDLKLKKPAMEQPSDDSDYDPSKDDQETTSSSSSSDDDEDDDSDYVEEPPNKTISTARDEPSGVKSEEDRCANET